VLAVVAIPTISCQLRSENVHQEADGPGFESQHLHLYQRPVPLEWAAASDSQANDAGVVRIKSSLEVAPAQPSRPACGLPDHWPTQPAIGHRLVEGTEVFVAPDDVCEPR